MLSPTLLLVSISFKSLSKASIFFWVGWGGAVHYVISGELFAHCTFTHKHHQIFTSYLCNTVISKSQVLFSLLTFSLGPETSMPNVILGKTMGRTLVFIQKIAGTKHSKCFLSAIAVSVVYSQITPTQLNCISRLQQ